MKIRSRKATIDEMTNTLSPDASVVVAFIKTVKQSVAFITPKNSSGITYDFSWGFVNLYVPQDAVDDTSPSNTLEVNTLIVADETSHSAFGPIVTSLTLEQIKDDKDSNVLKNAVSEQIRKRINDIPNQRAALKLQYEKSLDKLQNALASNRFNSLARIASAVSNESAWKHFIIGQLQKHDKINEMSRSAKIDVYKTLMNNVAQSFNSFNSEYEYEDKDEVDYKYIEAGITQTNLDIEAQEYILNNQYKTDFEKLKDISFDSLVVVPLVTVPITTLSANAKPNYAGLYEKIGINLPTIIADINYSLWDITGDDSIAIVNIHNANGVNLVESKERPFNCIFELDLNYIRYQNSNTRKTQLTNTEFDHIMSFLKRLISLRSSSFYDTSYVEFFSPATAMVYINIDVGAIIHNEPLAQLLTFGNFDI